MILLHGEVNTEMVTTVAEALYNGNATKFHLCSDGGDIYSALAIYDLIRARISNEITIYASGIVGSAAVLILAAGDKRKIAPNTHIMLHENALEDLTAYTNDLQTEARQIEKLEDQICKLLSKRTKTDYYRWIAYHKGTQYIDAETAVELGLADEIIKDKDNK